MNNFSRISTRKLLIVGAGGLGKEYCWVAGEMNRAARVTVSAGPLWEIVGFVDEDLRKRNQVIGGYPVHGSFDEASNKFAGTSLCFAVAIGDNEAREQAVSKAIELGWTPVTLAHPSAVLSEDAGIEEGVYIAPGVVVCPSARIGRFVIVNTHASIGHDSTLEDYVQVCPGARVSGGCRIEKGGFIGSNASLGPKAVVGARAVVGANSFVIRRVAPGTTVLGCPAVSIGTTRQVPESK